MNTITLNDLLKRAFTGLHWPDKERTTILNSPCLTLNQIDKAATISREDAEAIHLVGEDDILRTPFPLFRFYISSGNKGSAIFGFAKREHGNLFVFAFQRLDAGLGEFCFSVEILPSDDPFAGDLNFRNERAYYSKTFADATSVCRDLESKDEDIHEILGSLCPSEAIRMAQKRIRELGQSISAKKNTLKFLETLVMPAAKHYQFDERNPHSQISKAEFAWMALHGILMLACYEYLAPYNFTAVVRPEREGKSVEWIKAREHYTVIHRKHPANTVGFSGTVRHSDEAMKRLAHSRRAHTRLLSNPRYRFKRGMRVPVRASWVGPKEWRDTAGQIYRILTPVEDRGLNVAA